MPVIDADTHVIETDETFSYMTEKEAQYKPKTLTLEEQDRMGRPRRGRFWFFDEHLESKGPNPEARSHTPAGAAEMRDIETRLKDMDRLGVDVHVLYPTLMLGMAQLARPETQVAMCRSYNRWLADVCTRGNGRFRWIVVLPMQTMSEALEELRFGKEHGACGFLMKGIIGERTPIDKYFFPLYEEAQRLDMPVCVHSGEASKTMKDLFHSRATGLWRAKVPVFTAFHSLFISGVPDRFPRLRWAFLEASAAWVPYLLSDLGARAARMDGKEAPTDLMQKNRFYVACQTEDDLPYILSKAGDDNIVAASDYSHADTSSELDALPIIRERGEKGDLPAQSVKKILDDNARALYAL